MDEADQMRADADALARGVVPGVQRTVSDVVIAPDQPPGYYESPALARLFRFAGAISDGDRAWLPNDPPRGSAVSPRPSTPDTEGGEPR